MTSTTGRRKSQARPPKTGQLRIGNQWNAITIIAQSQTHPLKAVCELTENAIDAGAQHLQIIRRRSKGDIYLELLDDGSGVLLNEVGEPDFARIATHVCDSMKRHLQGHQRDGVHGEFGIGLLSFWSLASELRLSSADKDGRLHELQLSRGKRSYTIRPVRGELPLAGTRVIVGPLLEATRKIVTGEKLVRYLATELRDRIRSSGVQIRVVDRISRKNLLVEPREFEGEPVRLPSAVATPFGNLLVELYYRDVPASRNGGVAVCKDGTRVLRDITELIQFQRTPWVDNRVEGVLDFASLALAPGTRGGIVPDEKCDAFVSAVQSLEPPLLAGIEQRDRAESDKASRDILRQVHKAFVSALRELPPNEYLFFDIPESTAALAKSARNSNPESRGPAAMSVPRPVGAKGKDTLAEDETPIFIPLDPGPLATVRITPRHARRRPGESCRLTAVCRDEFQARVVEGVSYHWRIAEGEGKITATDNQAEVTGTDAGVTLIEVTAEQDPITVCDQVSVKFLEEAPPGDDDSAKGLPSYRLEPEHGKPWRSRYDDRRNEIIINSAHRDFVSSKSTGAKHRRYIGKLYAKEVVLINFPHESPADVMERLIELTLRTEDVL